MIRGAFVWDVMYRSECSSLAELIAMSMKRDLPSQTVTDAVLLIFDKLVFSFSLGTKLVSFNGIRPCCTIRAIANLNI